MIPLTFIPAAFFAGVLMFLAPCTLPIVPGYLAFIAGAQKGEVLTRRKILVNAIAFVVGFTLIFVLLGVFSGSIGLLLGPWRQLLGRLAGVMFILFGITMLGLFQVPMLSRSHNIQAPHFLTLGRWESSLFLGILFALGWSPCIGPILGTLLLFASISGSALQGALLLTIFSLGLGVPFILSALCIKEISRFTVRAGVFTRILSVCAASILIFLGVLMVLGDTGLLISWGYGALSFIHYDNLLKYM